MNRSRSGGWMLALGAMLASPVGLAGGASWPVPGADPGQRAAALVDAMSLDEQIAILQSEPGSSPLAWGIKLPASIPASMRRPQPAAALGSAGYAAGIPRLGFPALQESDAGLGVANNGFMRPGDMATALPSSLALAAAFDPQQAELAGQVVGKEAHAKGFNVQLAGGIDLIRDPRNGRNFEYASEDPLLSGLIVGASIAGIQSQHIVSTIKHYALNDQETGREVLDAKIDQAALRESDLLAFQIAIERGHPGAVMCAYNKVNGDYACENRFLLSQVLKSEWRYQGWVMSDWGAVHSLQKSVQAGLDQESPQAPHPGYFSGLKQAVAAGTISKASVREMALRIVRAFVAVGALDDPARPGGAIDQAADGMVAQHIAETGSVLLKNQGLLPLAPDIRQIAVIGGKADRGVLSGSGSSQVTPYGDSFHDYRGAPSLEYIFSPLYDGSSPLKALQAAFPKAKLVYADGVDSTQAAALARQSDVALVFAVKPQVESMDAPDLNLPHRQDPLIAAVAAANPRTVVVLETGNPIAMPWLDQVAAVLEVWFPGQRGGEAIAALLSGQVAPSGRLPISFPASVDDLPRPAIPGFDPHITMPFNLEGTSPPFDLLYTEGSDVGYRWYERSHRRPLFPFGYGLTYTRFAYAGLQVRRQPKLSVSFTLRNTGARAGIEVAQLYVAPPGRTHRLVGWARVALQPGQSRTVSIDADPRLLASYDRRRGQWIQTAGSYDVYVGQAAGNALLHQVVALEVE